MTSSTHKELRIEKELLKGIADSSSPQELKAQIDSILQNDFAVLNKNPSISHHSLLTKHNNPLLLNYVKHIYNEYNIKDPLPSNFKSKMKTEPGVDTQLNTSVKRKKSKLHLYSSQAPNKFSTPLREQNRSDSQHIKTEPNKKPLSLGPSSSSKDQIQNEITIKKQTIQKESSFKASSYYFEVKSPQQSFLKGYNQNSTFIEPDRVNLSVSRKYEKGKEMRIEVQEHFESIDQGVQVNEFNIPVTPTLPVDFMKESSVKNVDIKQTQTDQRTLVSNNESFIYRNDFSAQNLIQGAEVAQSRLMMPHPLPQIIKVSSAQMEEINQNFRYCIGCERALLDANIQIHQKQCDQFKKVFALTPTEIIQHLKLKIRKFQTNIQRYSQQLLKIDPSQLGQHSQKMLSESRSILGDGQVTKTYQQEYGEVVQISRKWCLMTEQINKVNWFLKIRQRVKKELQI